MTFKRKGVYFLFPYFFYCFLSESEGRIISFQKLLTSNMNCSTRDCIISRRRKITKKLRSTKASRWCKYRDDSLQMRPGNYLRHSLKLMSCNICILISLDHNLAPTYPLKMRHFLFISSDKAKNRVCFVCLICLQCPCVQCLSTLQVFKPLKCLFAQVSLVRKCHKCPSSQVPKSLKCSSNAKLSLVP